jgi:retinol dehydrogenase-12
MVTDYMSSPDYPIITNFVNPGFCHSELMRERSTLGWILKKAMGARKTEVGARTLVHGTQAGQPSHGQYLSDCTIKDPAPFVTSEAGVKLQKRVWEELSEKLEKIHPGILKNL